MSPAALSARLAVASSESLAAAARSLGITRQRLDHVLNPDRYLARRAVYRAVRSGRLARPSVCDRCGAGGRVEAHHADHARRLDVRWLCHGCHVAVDRAAGRSFGRRP